MARTVPSLVRTRIGATALLASFLAALLLTATSAPVDIEIAGLYAITVGAVATGPQAAGMGRLAVHFIRNDPFFNEHINFTVNFMDDAGDLTQAFINALDAVQTKGYKVLVGPDRSAQSQLVSAVGAAFGVPLVSYSSSSPTLSSKTDYAYFFRTCPSDTQQSQVWLSIMNHYDWRRCAILASNDAYGAGTPSAFLSETTSRGISVTTVAYFNNGATDFTAALEAIRSTGAKIIMLSALADEGGRLALKQAVKLNMLGPKSGYTWILSEGAAVNALLLDPAFEGEFDLSNTEFQAALAGSLGTQPRGGSGDLWNSMVSYWGNQTNNPDYPGAPSTDVIANDIYVPYSVDAVYSVAHALRSLVVAGTPINGSTVKAALATTDFEGVTGSVFFNSDQDRIVPYVMTSLLTDGSFLPVADWTVDSKTGVANFTVLKSVTWPDGTTNTPSDGIPRREYWIEWSSATSIVILTFVGIAILICAVTVVIIIKLLDTPIMRLASPAFLVITLVGLMIFFSSLVPWMGHPSQATCSLRNWLGHLGFCLAIAAIIAKTYRVDVIFRRRKKIKKVVVSNFELVKYVAFIMAPIIILMIVWTIVDRPKVKQVTDSENNRINITCGSGSPAWLIAALVYDAFLMFVSLFLSFRTRRVPDGFNESWYIYLSGYNTLVMGILGIVLGYILKKNLIAVTVIVSVALLLGGLVIWGLLFLPKLYIGLLHPERNNSMLRSTRSGRNGNGTSQYSANPHISTWASSNTIHSSVSSGDYPTDNGTKTYGTKSSGSKNDSKSNGSKTDDNVKQLSKEAKDTKETKDSKEMKEMKEVQGETSPKEASTPKRKKAKAQDAAAKASADSTPTGAPKRSKKSSRPKKSKVADPEETPSPAPAAASAPVDEEANDLSSSDSPV